MLNFDLTRNVDQTLPRKHRKLVKIIFWSHKIQEFEWWNAQNDESPAKTRQHGNLKIMEMFSLTQRVLSKHPESLPF